MTRVVSLFIPNEWRIVGQERGYTENIWNPQTLSNIILFLEDQEMRNTSKWGGIFPPNYDLNLRKM